MNLIIDIGNTYIKTGLFSDDELIEQNSFMHEDGFFKYFNSINFKKAIISNVGRKSFQIDDKRVLVFDSNTFIPVKNNYKTKQTLGLDRLAAVVGAFNKFKNNNILVIDCGSCITYDFLTSEGSYEGGGITVGLEMKLKALNNFTAKLPLVEISNFKGLIGNTTETSILSGVINGTIAEISGIIQQYQNISDNLAPVLCGGDAQFVSDRLDFEVPVIDDLVLIGLNQILKINE